MAQGTCAQELRTALATLSTAYRMQVETIGLRGVRPITRTRWLAFCPQRGLWDNLPLQIRQGIVNSEWEPRASTLRSLGIPRETCDRGDLQISPGLLQRYIDPAYLPRTHHSRFLQDWDALPALTHSMGSEFGPCPCGCRSGGLSEVHLRRKGVFALLVRTGYGARFPAPEELAQLMGFPRDPFWRQVDPMEGISLLGNSISPLHAARVMGRSRLFQLALEGESCPPTSYLGSSDPSWQLRTPRRRHSLEQRTPCIQRWSTDRPRRHGRSSPQMMSGLPHHIHQHGIDRALQPSHREGAHRSQCHRWPRREMMRGTRASPFRLVCSTASLSRWT